MARSRTRPPAWYPEPRDPAVLRYWDGSRWTDLRRPRPTWVPSQPVDERAAATSVFLPPRERTAPQHDPRHTRHPHHSRQPLLDPDARNRLVRAKMRRARTFALASFTALLAAVSALGVEFQIRHRQAVPQIHDQAFVTAAEADCAAELSPIRQQQLEPAGGPAQDAARVDSLSTTLSGVADQLRQIPVQPNDQAAVDDWLSAWDTFAAIGHRYAAAERAGDRSAPSVATTASAARAKIDDFASVNHLRDCEVG